MSLGAAFREAGGLGLHAGRSTAVSACSTWGCTPLLHSSSSSQHGHLHKLRAKLLAEWTGKVQDDAALFGNLRADP